MGPRALRCRPRAAACYAWAYSGATPFGDGPIGSFSCYVEPSNPSPSAPKKSQGRAENLDSIRTPFYKLTQSVASLRQLSEYPGTLSELDWNGCPNSSESAPLHYAAYKDHKDVVELLLANHADPNATNNDGYTPLRWAMHEGHTDVLELLRQHGGHE
jgi:hypothetical protein